MITRGWIKIKILLIKLKSMNGGMLEKMAFEIQIKGGRATVEYKLP